MVMSSLVWWLLSVAGSLVIVFAVLDVVLARTDRRHLADLDDDALTRRAAERVVAARAAMTEAVDADELSNQLARSRQSTVSGVGGVDGSSSGETPIDDVVETPIDDVVETPIDDVAETPIDDGAASERDAALVRARDDAREALLDAQRLWEVVRPPYDTPVRLALWAGRGRFRAWQLGPIGFERAILRCDHLLDPGCWEVSEYRRVRFGFGLGAESASIALFAARAPTRRLNELIDTVLCGSEVAFRPGRSPVRSWRRRSHTARVTTATDALFADRALDRSPSRETISALSAAIEEEFGASALKAGLPQLPRPTAYCCVAGPSLLIGAWWGPRPRRRRCAASSHLVWRDRP